MLASNGSRGHLAGGAAGYGYIGAFSRNNLAANQTDQDLWFLATSDFDSFVAPRAMKVTGLSFHVKDGSTTGSITISLFKNGSDAGATYDVTEANATNIYGRKVFDVPLELAAGDRLGIVFSTTSDWNGTSSDITAFAEAIAGS